jgi:YjbE family integral membrane protein
MIEFFQQLNWVIVGQIILIDILLGGDNAIVIALACRHLPEDMRFKGIVGGALGAIVIRIVLIAFAVTLLTVPYLKIIGGVLLLWIGVKLLFNQEEENDDIDGGDRLITAIKTVIIADLVMSIDNVIAVAGAAEQASADHKLVLVVFGIMVSIPVVIWGSSVILRIMDRVPAVVTMGAALLGYLGGSMIATDVAIKLQVAEILPMDLLSFHDLGVHLSLTGSAGALLVVLAGWWFNQRGSFRHLQRMNLRSSGFDWLVAWKSFTLPLPPLAHKHISTQTEKIAILGTDSHSIGLPRRDILCSQSITTRNKTTDHVHHADAVRLTVIHRIQQRHDRHRDGIKPCLFHTAL